MLSKIVFTIIIIGLGFSSAIAQSSSDNFSLTKNNILTSFSLDWEKASRNTGFSHEFERSSTKFEADLNVSYLITSKISAGPTLSALFVERHFEDPIGFFPNTVQRTWDFKYGGHISYQTRIKKLLSSNVLGNSYMFFSGGINWVKRSYKIEYTDNTTSVDNLEFGYEVSAGLLVPLGKKIALRWGINREAREHTYYYIQPNSTEISEKTKWPTTLSLSIGFIVKL